MCHNLSHSSRSAKNSQLATPRFWRTVTAGKAGGYVMFGCGFAAMDSPDLLLYFHLLYFGFLPKSPRTVEQVSSRLQVAFGSGRQRLSCSSRVCSPDLLFYIHLLYFFACGRRLRREQVKSEQVNRGN